MHAPQASTPTLDGPKALTEKEKETLRLLLAGHDAKSAARHLNLSVHTINERLRDARRKLSVSSSKEAARLLRDSEAPDPRMSDPQSLGYTAFGDGTPLVLPHVPDQLDTASPARRRAARAIGGCTMLFLAAAVGLALLSPTATTTTAIEATATTAPAATASAAAQAARAWLELGDRGDFDGAWEGTTASFRTANTIENWRAVSQKVRLPLGRVVTRTLLDEQDVPAPPNGYRTVRFRTDFANKRGALETLSMERDGDAWKVAGIYLE